MPRLRLLPVAAAVSLLAGLAVAPGPAAAQAASPASEPAAGQSAFVPLPPVRLLDTRDGTGGTRGPVGAGGTVDLRVADGARVPSDATAVVLNVTATAASSGTDVRVYPAPADAGFPEVSNLNVVPGQTVANQVTVKAGRDGRVRLRNQSGTVHLLADLAGYFRQAGAAGGSSYVGARPVRLLDTRGTAAFGAGEERPLDVRTTAGGGASGVPAEATAVVLNVTAVGATRTTDVRAYPWRPGGLPPEVSSLNTGPGRTVPNLVTVAVGDASRVALRNAAGSVHLVADLAGWYVPGSGAATFHPVQPHRVLDTRDGGAVGPGEARTLVLAGAGVVPAVASAVVLNVTAVGASASSDVRVYPVSGGSPPEASNLNVVRGQTVPNAVLATVGRGGAVALRNAAGSVHLVVDVAGWYGPTGTGWDISWPQCTSAGATTSRLPEGGGFAVVGLTRSRPFTDNECFAAQWAWASSLPGEPQVYVNVNAPGPRDSVDGRVWAEVCGTGTPTSACGQAYGERIAAYAVPRIPLTPGGGRPMVWMDVEGPYANGPFWQTGYAGAVAVNRAVIQGLVDGLRRAGHRVGTYSDRGSVADPNNDWRAIVGGWRLLQMQNWVFRSPDADPQTICGPEHSFSGGPVVMAQVQPATNPGAVFDVNGLC